jgi:hypothetical protein
MNSTSSRYSLPAALSVSGTDDERAAAADSTWSQLSARDLMMSLMPADDCTFVSISHNRALLDGWATQPSPCCAAASVAGAFNSLAGLRRDGVHRVTHTDALHQYRVLLAESLFDKQRSFERRLGAPITDLLVSIADQLKINNARSLTARSGSAQFVSRRDLMAVLTVLASQHHLSKLACTADVSSESSSVTDFVSLKSIDCVVDLMLADGVDLTTTPQLEWCVMQPAIAADALIANTAVDGDEPEDDLAVEDGSTATSFTVPAGSKSKSSWDWVGELLTIIRSIGGFNKLTAERASTAAIGNVNLIKCVARLSDRFSNCDLAQSTLCMPIQVSARVLMGKSKKGSNIEHTLSKKDDHATIDAQWSALRSTFCRQDSVLLFHLKNHYALVFALREWRDEQGVHRQLLTARKGQRPSAWIDFAEARETMLAWEGYKV